MELTGKVITNIELSGPVVANVDTLVSDTYTVDEFGNHLVDEFDNFVVKE